MKEKKLKAEHGTVVSMPKDFFGYFAWPSVGRLEDGTLVAVASGLRAGHICPFGRNVLCTSHDEGKTWSSPRVINDTPLDDRDAGIVPLGGSRMLLTWFTADRRDSWMENHLKGLDDEQRCFWEAGLKWFTDEAKGRFEGAWMRISDDAGATWKSPIKTPVNSPHGPILLRDGSLLYFGKDFSNCDKFMQGRIIAVVSQDDGITWQTRGEVPLLSGTSWASYHEAHVVELPDKHLIGMIRLQNSAGPNGDLSKFGLVNFSILQTESSDGGMTWTQPRPLGFHGSPPHIIRHSSGVLILTYGYRLEPYGQRVAFSYDNGVTWDHDWILRDDGPNDDLGYPATVELPCGELVTVYYQKPLDKFDKCAILHSRWSLPR